MGSRGAGCAHILLAWTRLKASRAFWNRQAGARDGPGVPLGPGPRAAPLAGTRCPGYAQGAGGGSGWAQRRDAARAALVHHAGPICRLRGAGESPGCPFPGWARRFPLGTITPRLQTCFPSLHSGRSVHSSFWVSVSPSRK